MNTLITTLFAMVLGGAEASETPSCYLEPKGWVGPAVHNEFPVFDELALGLIVLKPQIDLSEDCL